MADTKPPDREFLHVYTIQRRVHSAVSVLTENHPEAMGELIVELSIKKTHKFLNLWAPDSQVMRLPTPPLKHQYSPPSTHSTQ